MFIPISCPTCGFALGDKYQYIVNESDELFLKLARETQAKLNLPNPKTDSELLDLAHTRMMSYGLVQDMNIGKILDKYHITSICCRTHVITFVPFKDHY